ncbi:MAG: flavin reductase [Clostridiales bacterium]|nr:flavin reductase [Clostridiales bacterium]
MGNVLTDKDRTLLTSGLNSTGIFVTLGQKTPNVMVAHWGTFGKMWGRDVFVLPIRSSKYSYQIITQTKSFALNVPAHDMRGEISRCDAISGYSCNKFQELGLHAKRAKSIEAYVLGECGLIVECKVIAQIPPDAITTYNDVKISSHTLFVGEIADCYKLN